LDDLTVNQLFDDRGQNGLTNIVVDHVDHFHATRVGQLVEVILELLVQDVLGHVHALGSDVPRVVQVVAGTENFTLVLVE
jgi:hypothetical protein